MNAHDLRDLLQAAVPALHEAGEFDLVGRIEAKLASEGAGEAPANASLIAEMLKALGDAVEEMDAWMLERTPTADDIDRMRSEFRALVAKAAPNQWTCQK